MNTTKDIKACQEAWSRIQACFDALPPLFDVDEKTSTVARHLMHEGDTMRELFPLAPFVRRAMQNERCDKPPFVRLRPSHHHYHTFLLGTADECWAHLVATIVRPKVARLASQVQGALRVHCSPRLDRALARACGIGAPAVLVARPSEFYGGPSIGMVPTLVRFDHYSPAAQRAFGELFAVQAVVAPDGGGIPTDRAATLVEALARSGALQEGVERRRRRMRAPDYGALSTAWADRLDASQGAFRTWTSYSLSESWLAATVCQMLYALDPPVCGVHSAGYRALDNLLRGVRSVLQATIHGTGTPDIAPLRATLQAIQPWLNEAIENSRTAQAPARLAA